MGGCHDRLVREGDKRLGGGIEGLGLTFQAALSVERENEPGEGRSGENHECLDMELCRIALSRALL